MLEETSTKVPKKTVGNIMTVLRMSPLWKGVLAYDTFRQAIVFTAPPPMRKQDKVTVQRGDPWTSLHATRAAAWMVQEEWLDVSSAQVEEAAYAVADQNKFHPVREYFFELVWDGLPRVDHFFTTYCEVADDAYTREVARILFLSAVARILTPGCKVDTMPVLIGAQGLRKSSLVETLAVGFYADTALDLGSKDAYQNLSGVMLYEIGEMTGLKESNRQKNFLSSRVDRYRPPYAKLPQDFDRQCIFVATTNEFTGHSDDHTGARRFLPVKLKTIHLESIRTDVDQLWAEAVTRKRRGEEHWPTEAARIEREEQQDALYAGDPWTEPVADWLSGPTCTKEGFTMSQVLTGGAMLPVDRQGKLEQSRMAQILHRLGYERTENKVTHGGTRVRLWRSKSDPADPPKEVTCPTPWVAPKPPESNPF